MTNPMYKGGSRGQRDSTIIQLSFLSRAAKTTKLSIQVLHVNNNTVLPRISNGNQLPLFVVYSNEQIHYSQGQM